VLNCTVSGKITSTPSPTLEEISNCGGIVGDNKGTVSGCTFNGNIIASIVGGIVGANSGTVSDCHKLSGSISTGGHTIYSGGIIGYIYSRTGNYSSVVVTGNTFSRNATGQLWGIGLDPRQIPAAPSNDGATPII
jgi:hypothetical protein